MRTFFILALFSLIPLFTVQATSPDEKKERYTISGHIKDAGNGEELIGATISVKELKIGTATNLYGFYSISLAPGTYNLDFSYIGYQTVSKTIVLTSNQSINVELALTTKEIEEVEITAERKDKNITKAEMSVQKLETKQIRQIPAFMGEVDVIKAIQLLPGVQASSEGSSGFSVRGGNTDQNLILLDEALVYNASHFMGFFSVFNNDALKDVTLYKGDMPAQYGGRLSSLLDIRMKEGNMKKFEGTGGIGNISSRLTLEGPIIKDKSSIIVSGRRTYFDALFFPLMNDKEIRNTKLYFYDLNAKVNYIVNDNNRIFLSVYFGRDLLKNKWINWGYGNATTTLRWNHVFSQKLFSNLSLIYSKYDYTIGTPEQSANALLWTSELEDLGVKYDFIYYLNPLNTLKFGVQGTHHKLDPGLAKGIGENSIFNTLDLPDFYSLEHAYYALNEQKVTDKLTLKYGLRFNMFNNIGKAEIYNFDENYNVIDSTVYAKGDIFNTYSGLAPRIGANYLLNTFSSVKASYARTYQYMHLARNSTTGTPLDIWLISTPNTKPQVADQFSIGYFRNFMNNKLETSVELYYKEVQNSIDFKDYANLFLNPKVEGELRYGTAKSYGAEFLIRYDDKKMHGWLSYTLAKSLRKTMGISLNNYYYSPYDKPHDVSLVLQYDIDARTTVSTNFVYSTGSPFNAPLGFYNIQNDVVAIYSKERNLNRYPDYHRLDLSLIYKLNKNLNTRWQHELNFSVYNVYSRANPISINFEGDENNLYVRKAIVTYIPILPSLTYNFKF